MRGEKMECQTDPELIRKVLKLERSIERLQAQRGLFATNLDKIKKEIEIIKSKKIDLKTKTIPSNRRSIKTIENCLDVLERLFNGIPGKIPTDIYIPHYTITLLKRADFGSLTIDSETGLVTVNLSGILFTIMHTLLTKYIVDSKNLNVPTGFKGAISRGNLDRTLYGGNTGKNKLNTNISRIRNLLLKNGFLDEKFIIATDTYIRLNINGGNISIIDMDKKRVSE